MASTTPFITQSRHGIWYYQRWIPIHFRKYNPNINRVFRLSLHTRNKREASRLSRLLSVRIDELALQFFSSPESFGKAMALLYESLQVSKEYPDFHDFEEHFLMGVMSDEYPSYLFEKAEHFNWKFREEFEKLETEIKYLKEVLLKTGSNDTIRNNKQLLDELEERIHPTLTDEQNPTLETIFDQWSEEKKESMLPSSYEEYYRMFHLFIRIVDDFNGTSVRINDLNADDIRQYRKIFSAIPVRTKTDTYTITELIQLKGNKKSETTIRNTYRNLGTIFEWIAECGYPFDENLIKVITRYGNIDPRDKDERVAFTDDELICLFNSDKYVRTGAFRTSGMYWVPLIALCTGARMAEILQLEKHDIYKVGKTHVFNFNDIDYQTEDQHKHIKNAGSRREVPIHKYLTDLDFLGYVKAIDGRIFADEQRYKNGKFKNFSNRYKTYHKQVGVLPDHPKQKKDFHSYRHTVETRLSESRYAGDFTFDQGLIDSIIGHASSSRSEGEKRYNKSQLIEAKSKALNQLKYDFIDFDKMIHWDRCSFWKNKFNR